MSRITIKNALLETLGTIPGVFMATRLEKINSDNLLTFTTSLTAENTMLFEGENIAEVDDDYFDIVYYRKGQSETGELLANVECEHVSYRLNDSDYDVEFFTEIGTPTYILEKILEGTGFTIGTVDFNETITYSAQEKMSRRLLLMDFIAYLGGEVLFNKFEISILIQRGSTTPKDLLTSRSVAVIGKTFSKREKDINGNPLVSYICDLVRPVDITLGDIITMDYSTLSIDVTLRVVSITKNPYNKYEASFEIGNSVSGLSDESRRIETSTLTKGKTYYGARISPEFGFESIRSDKFARTVMNADEFAMQSGDGTGTWTNVLYFDPILREFIFNGKVTSEVSVSETTITNVLYANDGNIARLTVDHFLSGSPLSGDAEINFIDIKNQFIKFITATRLDDLVTYPKIQYETEDSQPLYWLYDPEETSQSENATTTTDTGFQVMVYQYSLLVKLEISFEEVNGVMTPKMILGAGTGVGNNGKGYIYKGTDGLYLNYYKSTDGNLVQLKLTDDGGIVTGVNASKNLRNITISAAVPTVGTLAEGDVWLKYT